MKHRLTQTHHMALLLLLGALLLLPRLTTLGFWEGSSSKKGNRVQVRREQNTPVPTELSLLLQLEEESSTSWPYLVQWLYRGATRLPLPKELSARLPSVLFSLLLLLLVPLFLGTAPPKVQYASGLLLLVSPGFLLGGRALSPDTLWFFTSSLTIYAGYRLTTPRTQTTTVRWGFLGLLVLGSLLSFLARGVALGLLFPYLVLGVYTLTLGESPRLFSSGILALTALFLGLTLWALHSGGGHALLYTLPNPATTTPTAKAPHALFTNFLPRALFALFPWGALLLTALPFALPTVRREEERLSLLCVIWIVVALFVCAYYEMRVGDVLFPALLPAALLTGRFLMERKTALLKPLPALVLALTALLFLRDLLQSPQALPEIITHYSLPPLSFSPARLLTLGSLGLFLPLLVVILRGLGSLPTGLTQMWQRSKRAGIFPWLLFTLLRPLTLLFSPVRRIPLKQWYRLLSQKTRRLPRWFRSHALALGILLPILFFGFWFSWSFTRALSLEYSTRYIFSSYARIATPTEELGVSQMSTKGAELYAGKQAYPLTTEREMVQFLLAPTRRFVALPAVDLGRLDSLLRKRRIPYTMPAPPAPKYMLISNRRGDGEEDHNPLAALVTLQKPPFQFPHSTLFEDRIELVGYTLPRRVRKGSTIAISLVFRVDAPIHTNYKIFLHLDPPYGTRITGDHKPVQGLLPTKYWTKGTYVLDRYRIKIPRIGFPVGRYRLYAGLFIGSRRMKITGGKNGGSDRAPLGTMVIQPARLFSCGK